MITTPEVYEDRRAVLQNRPHTSDPEDGNFFGLLAALDAGWHIASRSTEFDLWLCVKPMTQKLKLLLTRP
jgi:hypothetical protein